MLMFPSKAIDWFIEQLTEAYSEPSRTSKIEPFVKIVNHFQKVNYFRKSSILDVWLGSENFSG